MRRARKARAKISELRVHRLSVHRTGQHIYAQVIDSTGGKVIASASTVDKELRGSIEGCKSNIHHELYYTELLIEKKLDIKVL